MPDSRPSWASGMYGHFQKWTSRSEIVGDGSSSEIAECRNCCDQGPCPWRGGQNRKRQDHVGVRTGEPHRM